MIAFAQPSQEDVRRVAADTETARENDKGGYQFCSPKSKVEHCESKGEMDAWRVGAY